mmetsp:Transcript_1619/g.5200  ORF Transcript_1619/g.5200 Transcript_1619/m.5200 type:complete len:239 (+) Transcript_1619:1701-2417(+)
MSWKTPSPSRVTVTGSAGEHSKRAVKVKSAGTPCITRMTVVLASDGPESGAYETTVNSGATASMPSSELPDALVSVGTPAWPTPPSCAADAADEEEEEEEEALLTWPVRDMYTPEVVRELRSMSESVDENMLRFNGSSMEKARAARASVRSGPVSTAVAPVDDSVWSLPNRDDHRDCGCAAAVSGTADGGDCLGRDSCLAASDRSRVRPSPEMRAGDGGQAGSDMGGCISGGSDVSPL